MNLTKPNKNLVLVGMMGSGKTKLGRYLAKKLKYQFYDTDEEIEKKLNLQIFEIFENFGEKYFRELEEVITMNFLKKKRSVISLGGGGYLNYNIRKAIQKSCVAIWLKWNSKTLIDRVKRNQKRPIIRNMKTSEIEKLIEKRSKIYSRADIMINCEGKIRNNIISKIIKNYENI